MVSGVSHASLTAYYVAITKGIQEGHNCNLSVAEVSRLIQSPRVGLFHALLNMANAAVCDVVHWGLTDLATKYLAVNQQV